MGAGECRGWEEWRAAGGRYSFQVARCLKSRAESGNRWACAVAVPGGSDELSLRHQYAMGAPMPVLMRDPCGTRPVCDAMFQPYLSGALWRGLIWRSEPGG
jgi:hypothetical protein